MGAVGAMSKHTIGTREYTCRFPKGHEGAHQDTIGSTGVTFLSKPELCGAILGYANGTNTTCRLPKGHDGAHHTRAWLTERESVRALGERIGYGRLMQYASETWSEKDPGAEFGIHCCSTFLVPCPGCDEAKARGEHCQWCCGSGRVTKRVAAAIECLQGKTHTFERF